MQKQFKNNPTLWDTLNWVLKGKKNKPTDIFSSSYVLNRWLSMTNSNIANIINITGNRWCKIRNEISLIDFYHQVLPKFASKIQYIKKNTTESDFENIKEISNALERSTKEIIFLEKGLEELKNLSK